MNKVARATSQHGTWKIYTIPKFENSISVQVLLKDHCSAQNCSSKHRIRCAGRSGRGRRGHPCIVRRWRRRRPRQRPVNITQPVPNIASSCCPALCFQLSFMLSHYLFARLPATFHLCCRKLFCIFFDCPIWVCIPVDRFCILFRWPKLGLHGCNPWLGGWTPRSGQWVAWHESLGHGLGSSVAIGASDLCTCACCEVHKLTIGHRCR